MATAPQRTVHQHREWPTVAVAVAVVAWFAAVTTLGDRIHPLAVVVLVGVLTTWHGSLQHELVHGHLGAGRAATVLGWAPVSLWVPYDAYRRMHLRHHRDTMLTDPYEDPESWYQPGEAWRQRPGPVRAVLWWNRTLLGRMTVGPALGIGAFFIGEARLLRAGHDGARRRWAVHLPVAMLLCAWVVVAPVPFWAYALGAVWVGTALTMVRSFAEHRWMPDGRGRTAMVRANPLLALLFLNNNLHVAHHLRPRAPWYELPRIADELGCDAIAASGAGLYRGYGEIVRRYLVRPFCQPGFPPDHGEQTVPRLLRRAQPT